MKTFNVCINIRVPRLEISEQNFGISLSLFNNEITRKLVEKLGEYDRYVLNLLSKNSKTTIISIAEEAGLSITGVEKINARLKGRKIIKTNRLCLRWVLGCYG